VKCGRCTVRTAPTHMELIMIWQVFRRWWWLIVLPVAVAFLVVLPSLKNVISPPVSYVVQVRLTAAAPPEAQIDGITTPYEDTVYVPLLASEYVVVNMPPWITSDSFASEVHQALAERGQEFSEDDLRTAFFADSLRSILTLYVVWDESEEIQAIAQEAVSVLQTRNQTYFPQFAAEPVKVVALDEVQVDELASPIMTRLGPLLRIALALAAGIVLALLAEYLDMRIRSRAQVESLGFAVLAEIPPER
jgi:capsular polysaccharide biosynthesis protein